MWYELTISALNDTEVASLDTLLEDSEAVSQTFIDAKDTPLYEPALHTTPLWQDTIVKALFESDEARIRCMQMIKPVFPHAKFELSDLKDKAWEREWLKDFKPMQFGKRLWVCPTHETPPDSDAVNIMLDPGLAFGTGTHETTSLCLSYLDGLNLKDKIVCDYGTGSGILGIAAIKLGAKKAYCVDIDAQAITATLDNAYQNDIDDTAIEAFLVDKKSIPTVDLLIANILSGPLCELASNFSVLVSPGGTLVLSGILETQRDEVIKAYTPYFDFKESDALGDWVRLVFEIKT